MIYLSITFNILKKTQLWNTTSEWVEPSKINVFDFSMLPSSTWWPVSAYGITAEAFQCFGKGPWWKSPETSMKNFVKYWCVSPKELMNNESNVKRCSRNKRQIVFGFQMISAIKERLTSKFPASAVSSGSSGLAKLMFKAPLIIPGMQAPLKPILMFGIRLPAVTLVPFIWTGCLRHSMTTIKCQSQISLFPEDS